MRLVVFGVSLFVLFTLGVAAGLLATAAGYFDWGTSDTGNWGKFPRPPVVELLDNGRQMRLLEDFAYVDPHGTVWTAPKDSIVDGASIPRVFWTITGGPLEGKFRNASIVHDVACDRMSVPSDKVHQMFYEACRCGGVPENEASLLYAAVYHFGPEWDIKEEEAPVVVKTAQGKTRQMKIRRRNSELVEQKDPTDDDRKALEQYVHERKRSLDDLRRWPGKGDARSNAPGAGMRPPNRTGMSRPRSDGWR
jgi:hypothetical protein